jgi:alpha-mannosidase
MVSARVSGPAIGLLAALVLFLNGLQAGEGIPASLREVIVVFKTHFDIGYTDMASNVVQRYRSSMIDDALQVVEANRDLPPEQQFVWTLAAWPLAKILGDWPGQSTERQQAVMAAFQQGRFVSHALPFTTHTELLELEDLVRGLGFSSRLSRDAGLSLPRDAKMTDVPSHSWIMPTLLKHAGVDFLHLGCNAASRSPRVPRLFFWEGPDGSRLLTMYTAESYGTGLVPPADWPYQTWLALIHTGDNHGPPRPEEVKALLDEANVKLPGIKVRIGRLSDFADGILAEQMPVPVVRGDMPDTWIHGPMSDPQGASLARRVRPEIASAEALNTLLSCWGLEPPSAQVTIARAYEQSLLYGEHTWGGAYWWIYGNYRAHYGDAWREERAAGRFDRIESSWAEHTAYIETTEKITRPCLDDQLEWLARSVNAAGPRIVVFNPLPWRRDGRVVVRSSQASIKALKPVGGGTAVPLTPGADGSISFSVLDLPSLGYRTYVPADPPTPVARVGCDQTAGLLESPHLRALVDTNRMVLRSLIDKASGRELVKAGAVHGFGQYVHERFSSEQVDAFVKAYVKIDSDWATNELGKPMLPVDGPASCGPPTAFRTTYELTPDRVSLHGVATDVPGLKGPLRVSFELRHNPPCFEMLVALDKPADPWPEAGWIAFPFNLENPRFRLGRLGSIVDPANDLVPGVNRHVFALNGGLTVTSPDGFGVGLLAMDSPLVSLGQPGCWKYSVEDFPRASTVYVNLFNNQWTTNFRLWNEGTWTSRVRLWALAKGADDEAALVTPAIEARHALVGVEVDGPAGPLPSSASGFELSRRGVQLTAFGPNPDGPGTVLRLWELAGQAGDCRVRLPVRWKAREAQPVDLRGRPTGNPVPIVDDAFVVPLRAFAPASFVFLP